MKKNIANWLSESLKEINNFGDVKDIHIDELSDIEPQKPQDYLTVSCTILKELSLIAKDLDLSGYRLDLNIELKESSESKGRPKDITTNLKNIDILSMPEVLIYKPLPDTNLTVSTIEFYRTPVLFKICEGIEKFKVFYEEYRNYNDINKKENFSRWLSFVFENT